MRKGGCSTCENHVLVRQSTPENVKIEWGYCDDLGLPLAGNTKRCFMHAKGKPKVIKLPYVEGENTHETLMRLEMELYRDSH